MISNQSSSVPQIVNDFIKFTTSHPIVDSSSNNKNNAGLIAWQLDGFNRVIPTIIDGKKYSIQDAIKLAIDNGVDKYPQFETTAEAMAWAGLKNNNVNPDGTVGS